MSDLPTRSDTRPRKFPYLPVTWVLYFTLFCILTVDSCRDEYERWIMGKAGIGEVLLKIAFYMIFAALFLLLPALASFVQARRLRSGRSRSSFAAWLLSFGVVPGELFIIWCEIGDLVGSMYIFLIAYSLLIVAVTAFSRSVKYTVTTAAIYALYILFIYVTRIIFELLMPVHCLHQ